MTAGVVPGGGLVDEQQLERQLERQMGCMTGFFQMFDRGPVISGRRHYSTRRLASSPVAGSRSPSERSDISALSLLKENHPSPPSEPFSSPEIEPQDYVPPRPSLPLPLPVFDFKDGIRTSWKIREAPRLSLDSRAVLDAKGKLRPRDIRTTVPVSSGNQSKESAESERQRGSPSVVARLMGLDALPSNGGAAAPTNNSRLRRSASESRVARDPSNYRFVDTFSFEKPSPPEPTPISAEEFFKKVNVANFRVTTGAKKSDLPLQRSGVHPPLQRKSFFDAEDFFPEPNRSGSVYGEIEKRLRKRGIDEPARDLETLKQILEAIQLKGLLRSNYSGQAPSRRNLIYDDDSRVSGDSPIVLMRPVPRPPRRTSSESPPPSSRSVAWLRSPSASPDTLSPVRRDPRSVGLANDRRNRTSRSPENPSSQARRRATNAPELRKSPPTQPRTNAVSSPKPSPKRVTPPVAVRSPRIRRQPTPEVSSKERLFSPTEDDTSTTISESSLSASSQTDFERSRTEDCRSGRNLLERCDKLLDSITAFTAGEKFAAAAEQHPSPVSVLNSSNYFGREESSPSPVAATKRSISFKDRHEQLVEDREEDGSTPTGSNNGDESIEADDEEGDVDYAYLVEILRLSHRNPNAAPGDVYAALEKRRRVSNAPKAPSRLHHRLVFDTVAEILARKRQVQPWEAFARARSVVLDAPDEGSALLRHVWGELRRIQEQVDADDLNDVTCGAIRKDMGADERVEGGWGPHPSASEMSDAVLHIERQIFKDLVAEAIGDLADVSVKSSRPSTASRRKLVF